MLAGIISLAYARFAEFEKRMKLGLRLFGETGKNNQELAWVPVNCNPKSCIMVKPQPPSRTDLEDSRGKSGLSESRDLVLVS